jgi:hypothetical protein
MEDERKGMDNFPRNELANKNKGRKIIPDPLFYY